MRRAGKHSAAVACEGVVIGAMLVFLLFLATAGMGCLNGCEEPCAAPPGFASWSVCNGLPDCGLAAPPATPAEARELLGVVPRVGPSVVESLDASAAQRFRIGDAGLAVATSLPLYLLDTSFLI